MHVIVDDGIFSIQLPSGALPGAALAGESNVTE